MERADRFKNELIIAATSARATTPTKCEKLLETKLPPGLKERMKLWV